MPFARRHFGMLRASDIYGVALGSLLRWVLSHGLSHPQRSAARLCAWQAKSMKPSPNLTPNIASKPDRNTETHWDRHGMTWHDIDILKYCPFDASYAKLHVKLCALRRHFFASKRSISSPSSSKKALAPSAQVTRVTQARHTWERIEDRDWTLIQKSKGAKNQLIQDMSKDKKCNLQDIKDYLYIKKDKGQTFEMCHYDAVYDLATNPWEYTWYWQYWFVCITSSMSLSGLVVTSALNSPFSVGAWRPKKQLETKRRRASKISLLFAVDFEQGLQLASECKCCLTLITPPFDIVVLARGSRACGGRCEGLRTWMLNIQTFHLRFVVFSLYVSWCFLVGPKAQTPSIPSNT